MPALLLAALLLLSTILPAATQEVPPDAAWRTFDTPHFRVTFTAEVEPIARRAAARAEGAYELLQRELVRAPEGRIDLIVSNHVDLANGMATPFPRNRIILYAHPPTNTTSLDFTNDWLDLLVLHELVHIFHMDHATGPLGTLRTVFGRSPILFPQVWTTGWMLEGLAVYFESLLTGGGRVHGTHHEMILRTAILRDRFFSIDRVSGDPRTWPGGSTRYIYGSLFMEHLADRYGPESIPALVERTGAMIVPFRLNAAARRTFGVSFDDAWREWEDSLRTRYTALEDSLRTDGLTVPEVLVPSGRGTYFPRHSPAGDVIAFQSATGVDDPRTLLLEADGTVRPVERRFGGGPVTWRRDGGGFLDSQLEYRDRTRIFTDLRMVERDGRSRWVTRGARVWSADLHPGQEVAVAVADAAGTNVLAMVDLATGAVRPITERDLDVQWAHPRWSPDGETIAVSRMLPGARFDVVLIDAGGRVIREVTADRALDGTPTWSPDGRYVVFSSDRTGITNLYAFDVGSGELWQVTNVLTGAIQPDVSPDGRWIVFSHYEVDGYHIARVPFEPGTWRLAPAVRPEVLESPVALADPRREVAAAEASTRRYSPIPTVLPSTWVPIYDNRSGLGRGFGVMSWGTDLVGRHDWLASGTVYPAGTRLEGELRYVYRGLGNPQVTVDAEQWWRVQARAGTELPGLVLPQDVLRRDRVVGLGAQVVRPRARQVTWVGWRGELRNRELLWADPGSAPDGIVLADIPREAGASLNLGVSTVRGFALSIGAQEGVSLSTTLSGHRYLEESESAIAGNGYGRMVGRSRAYRGLFRRADSRDVIALRLDGGIERGSLSPLFDLGGTGGGSPGALVGLDDPHGYSFPIRGYPSGAQWGDRVALASAEYRVPLVSVERGMGLLPLYLARLSAGAFAEGGSAWCSDDCAGRLGAIATSPDPLFSIGVEALAELTFGFRFIVPLRAGVAVPLSDGYRPSVYLRTGRAF
jgi:hypothetical protein